MDKLAVIIHDGESLQQVEMGLLDHGFDVTVFSHPVSALQFMPTIRPVDLLVADYRLLEQIGLDVLGSLRSVLSVRQLVVAVSSGHQATGEVVTQWRIDRVLSKPIRVEELLIPQEGAV